MKRSALAGLFVCAAMLASPVFAAETTSNTGKLCSDNLQRIKDYLSSIPTTSENTTDNLKKAYETAQDAQAKGDNQTCVDVTTAEIAKIQKLTTGGNQ